MDAARVPTTRPATQSTAAVDPAQKLLEADLDALHQKGEPVRPEDLARTQARLDLKEVMGTPAGRRLMRHIIDARCQPGATSFAGEETHRAAFVEGRKDVGRELLGWCRRDCPQLWAQMVAEGLQEALQVKA